VALRWIVQRGAGFAVQSKSAAHFAEDLDVFGWELSPEEMARLSKVA
jgi:diketogulonate reductase-like aldo/keto reductase